MSDHALPAWGEEPSAEYDDFPEPFDTDGAASPEQGVDKEEVQNPFPFSGGDALPEEFVEFVEYTLVGLFIANGRSRMWCPRWFEHPAALNRLYALYLAYNYGLMNPLENLEPFFRLALDHHVPMLCSKETGIFRRCGDGDHTAEYPLWEAGDRLSSRLMLHAHRETG